MLRRLSQLHRCLPVSRLVHDVADATKEAAATTQSASHKFGPSAQWISAGMMLRMRRPKAAQSVAGRWSEGCLTVRQDESCMQAVRLMAANDVGCLVVLDPLAETVTGIITERCYSREVILKGRDSDTTTVAECMKRDVVCCTVDEKLSVIASVLSKHKIRHLPVLHGTTGITAEEHVLRLHTPTMHLKGVLSIKDVAFMLFCLVRNELQGRGIGNITVADMMPDRSLGGTLPVINAGSTVLEAIGQMANTDQHALCVLDHDDGGLVGIITTRDYICKMKVHGRESASTRVRSVMTPTPQCASPDFTLDDVLQLFTTFGFRHLPVVSAIMPGHVAARPSLHPHVVGLLSINDVLRTICAWPDRPLHWPCGQQPLDTAV